MDPLLAPAVIVPAVAAVTGRPEAEVRTMLDAEARRPGSTVAAEVARRGIAPHEWSDSLLDFYKTSDAFVFELIGWQRQRFKRSMRRWSRDFLRRERDGRPLRVLCHGDGLGYDALAFARDGHAVTYFEFPGPSERFARRLFDAAGVAVEVITDESHLGDAYDAVTSFDVLEHVPDPRQSAADLAARLADGGVLLVHAPFYLVLPNYPTHLRANRRHAGSTRLYERPGLTLVDGNALWNPLAFRKGIAPPPPTNRRAWLRTIGLALRAGRGTSLPFAPLQALARRLP